VGEAERHTAGAAVKLAAALAVVQFVPNPRVDAREIQKIRLWQAHLFDSRARYSKPAKLR